VFVRVEHFGSQHARLNLGALACRAVGIEHSQIGSAPRRPDREWPGSRNAFLAKGTISADPPLSVETTVRSADLRVLDPDLSASKRAEVQARMLGPEVLDTDKYSEISFVSTQVEPSGQNRWKVAGRLTIHGQTKPVTFGAMREKDVYRGSFTIKQRDFGITPITVAGGTVKVKDELRIEFAIAATQ